MILVLILTGILQSLGVPEAQALWGWFGDNLFWTVLMVIFLA